MDGAGLRLRNRRVPDLEVHVTWPTEERAREIARYLRVWFECVLDSLDPESLRLLRDRCRRANPSPANREIERAITQRLDTRKLPQLR